jgi:hypothetical protein
MFRAAVALRHHVDLPIDDLEVSEIAKQNRTISPRLTTKTAPWIKASPRGVTYPIDPFVNAETRAENITCKASSLRRVSDSLSTASMHHVNVTRAAQPGQQLRCFGWHVSGKRLP